MFMQHAFQYFYIMSHKKDLLYLYLYECNSSTAQEGTLQEVQMPAGDMVYGFAQQATHIISVANIARGFLGMKPVSNEKRLPGSRCVYRIEENHALLTEGSSLKDDQRCARTFLFIFRLCGTAAEKGNRKLYCATHVIAGIRH